MNKPNKQLIIGTLIISLLILTIMLIPWQDSIIVQTLRIIIGSIYILFLPGYRTTCSFFGHKEIDRLEKFALSFALSISVVPLLTFYVNLLGIKITQISVRGVVAFVIIANIIYIYKIKKEKNK